jgi:hypothetical protein
LKIEIEKSGGFAGIIKKAEIDTDNLDKSKRNRVKQLIEECTIHSGNYTNKNKTLPKGSADYIVYKISIIDGKRIVKVEFNEYTADASLMDLVNQLMHNSVKKQNN